MKGVDNNIKIFEIETDTKYFRSMCHGYIEKIIGIVLDKYIKE